MHGSLVRVSAIAVAVAVGLVACAHAGHRSSPTENRQAVLSLQDISCQSCGAAVARALERRGGVRAARFDRDKVEVSVEYDPTRTTEDALVTVASELGYVAVVGEGQGRYAAAVEFPAGLDVAWISKSGEAVDLEPHHVPAKVTVFDFYADWCGPCREVDREMLSVLKERTDVALRKINVTDWNSQVAKRYLANVPGLPYVVVYGRDGKRVAAISGLHLDQLRESIDKGAK